MREHTRGVKRPCETMNNFLNVSTSLQQSQTVGTGLMGGLADVYCSIQQCLPRLGEIITSQLVQRLQELGVHSIQDLKFTVAEDIGEIVKPIQARKLMKFWAEKPADAPHTHNSSTAATVSSWPLAPSLNLEDDSKDMLLEDVKQELCIMEEPLEDEENAAAAASCAHLATTEPEPELMSFVGVHFIPPSSIPCAPLVPALAVVPRDWVHRTMGKLEVEWPPPSGSGGRNAEEKSLQPAALICSADSFEEAASQTYCHWPNIVANAEAVSLSAKVITSLQEELNSVREELSNLASLMKDLLTVKNDLHGLLSLKNDLSNLVSLKADLSHVVSLKSDLSQQLACLKGVMCDLPAEVSALRSSLSLLQSSHLGSCQGGGYKQGGCSNEWVPTIETPVHADDRLHFPNGGNTEYNERDAGAVIHQTAAEGQMTSNSGAVINSGEESDLSTAKENILFGSEKKGNQRTVASDEMVVIDLDRDASVIVLSDKVLQIKQLLLQNQLLRQQNEALKKVPVVSMVGVSVADWVPPATVTTTMPSPSQHSADVSLAHQVPVVSMVGVSVADWVLPATVTTTMPSPSQHSADVSLAHQVPVVSMVGVSVADWVPPATGTTTMPSTSQHSADVSLAHQEIPIIDIGRYAEVFDGNISDCYSSEQRQPVTGAGMPPHTDRVLPPTVQHHPESAQELSPTVPGSETRKCPICMKYVVNLPRHMRTKQAGHQWTRNQAKYTAITMGCRKNPLKKYSNSEKRDSRPLKSCPEKNCFAIVTRLDKHMRQVHAKSIKIKNIFYNAEEVKLLHMRKKFISLLETFEAWQGSVDGSLLAPVTAERQREQVTRVIAGLKCSKFSDLLNVSKVNTYFSSKRTSGDWESSTITSYLFSVIAVMKYLRTESFACFFSTNEELFDLSLAEISEKAGVMKDDCNRWTRNYAKRSKGCQNDKYGKERNLLVTSDERDKCLFGPEYKKIEKLRAAFERGVFKTEMITCSHFTTVRDYLLLYIYVTHGHRTGLPCILQMEQFLSIRKVNDQKYVLDAPRHKISATHGYGRIILTAEAHSILVFYCNSIRQYAVKVSNSKMPFLFTTRDGLKMTSALAGAATLASWKKNALTRNIKPQLIRKSTSTVVFTHNGASTADAAALMLHKESTAASHYRRIDRENAAIRGQAAISVAWEQASKQIRTTEENADSYCEQRENVNGQKTVAVKTDSSSETSEDTADVMPDVGMSVDGMSDDGMPDDGMPDDGMPDDRMPDDGMPGSKMTLLKRRSASLDMFSEDDDESDEKPLKQKRGKGRARLFTHEETETLRGIFQNCIENKAFVTHAVVEEKLSLPESSYLKEKFTFGQIIAKVRYLKKISIS